MESAPRDLEQHRRRCEQLIAWAVDALAQNPRVTFHSLVHTSGHVDPGWDEELDAATQAEICEELGIPTRRAPDIRKFGIFPTAPEFPKFSGFGFEHVGVIVRSRRELGPLLDHYYDERTKRAVRLRILRIRVLIHAVDAFAEVRWTWAVGRMINRIGWTSPDVPRGPLLDSAALTTAFINTYTSEIISKVRGRPELSGHWRTPESFRTEVDPLIRQLRSEGRAETRQHVAEYMLATTWRRHGPPVSLHARIRRLERATETLFGMTWDQYVRTVP